MQPVDMVAWACQYLRTHISGVQGLQVGNREPPDYDGSYPLIVINDIGGYGSGYAHYRMGLAVSVLGFEHVDAKPVMDLTRRAYGLLTDYGLQADPTTPISLVLVEYCTLPTLVAQDALYARAYCSVEYVARGEQAYNM